jgi:hypothetical protein
MHVRKLAVRILLFLLVLAGAGYACAFASSTECEYAMIRDMEAKGVRGSDMGGRKMAPKEATFTTTIRIPFVVEVETSLPRDLHATVYRARYFATPWRVYEISRDAIYLV